MVDIIGQIKKRLQSWGQANAQQYIFSHISKANVSGVEYDETPLEPGKDYLRLWLCDMYLTASRTWFQQWFPAVHGTAEFKYADRAAITISRVMQPPPSVLGKGVFRNYELSPLMPFNGGTVEIYAGLVAMQGNNVLISTLNVLEKFNSLISAPISAALNVVRTVADGLDDLLNSFQGGVHLSFHETYSDEQGHTPVPGYYAVILATDQQITRSGLSVQDETLYYDYGPRNGGIKPLDDYDYMLFRVEKQSERRDWKFSYINQPLTEALNALRNDDAQSAQTMKRAAKFAAFTSLDLSERDRRNVLQAIDAEFAEFQALGLGAVPSADEISDHLIARALPSNAVSLVPVTLADLE